MIHTIHGIVDHITPGKQVTRSFLSKISFVKYLESKRTYYTSFDPENLRKECLMVDDATYAAAEACLIARHYGHEVYLFINPWQIANNREYFFSVLNAVIDNCQKDKTVFQNSDFDLLSTKSMKAFRQAVKETVITLSENAALTYLHELAEELMCTKFTISHFSKTLNIGDLMDLQKQGVKIQSHGWSHRSITAVEDLEKDLKESKTWILENLDIDANMYAVPFGKPNLPLHLDKTIYSYHFLADQSFPFGLVNSDCWNRVDISQTINDNFRW